jgi:hypothetical protein
MIAVVFGSPEAAAIARRDRETFGLSGHGYVSGALHRWLLITVGKKEVESTYSIVAATEEQARDIWHNGGGELIDEETTADADDFDCEITCISDEGEVTE